MVSIDRLKELLEYRPDSGEFIRKVRRGRLGLAGSVAGTINSKGYVVIEIDGRPFTAHRLDWLYMTGQEAEKDVDHIDRCKSNNAWSNLRLASNAENHHNRFEPQRNNTSGYLGVTFHKAAQKWAACIKKDGKRYHLGLHATPEAAHEAYLKAKRELHHFAFT